MEKYINTFEEFINENLLIESAFTGKQLKELKKSDWTYSKTIDRGTMKEISLILSKLLKKGDLDTKERNTSGWKVAEDDNLANWEMLTFSDEYHGPIKLVSYKEDAFNAKKYATIFVNFQGKWWYLIRSYRNVITDIVNIFANPNRFASPIDKFEDGFKYLGMKQA